MGKTESRATKPRWDGVVRRHVDCDVRAINQVERSVDVIASTNTLDAHYDILEQDWDLRRYRKNPVVLWNHNSCMYVGARPKDLLPIGHASNVRVEEGKLKATLTFVDEKASELAEAVWQGFLQRSIRAVSVGFKPGKVTQELLNGRNIYRLSENELREISVVAIPANPDAVAEKCIAQQERAWLAWMAKGAPESEAKAFGVDVEDEDDVQDESGASGESELGPENTKGNPASSEGSPARPGEPANEDNSMDLKQLQEAYEKALRDLAAAQAELASAKGKSAEELASVTKRATDAEAQVVALTKERDEVKAALEAEKKVSEKLEADVKALSERAANAETLVAKAELDARQGTKFAPAEREELEDLVKTVGIERVKRLLDARADLEITNPVKVDGKAIEDKSKGAPPPAAEGELGDGSRDFLSLVNKAVEAGSAREGESLRN